MSPVVFESTFILRTLQVATPTFFPPGGSYSSTQSVIISCSTPFSTIYYTTNGTTPVYPPSGSTQTYTGAITVSATETIEAIGIATGLAQSVVATANYSISLPQVATPTFSPVGGTYTGTQSVLILCSTPSSTIYYTTDGSTPTTSSNIYSSAVSVSTSEIIKALATAVGYTNSAIGSASYTINTGSSPNYPITQVSPINTTPGIPFTSLIAKYNYIIYQGGAYQTTNYHTGFAQVASYAASYTNQNPTNVCGFYNEDDQHWISTSTYGAFDDPRINFGLGNSPASAPGGYLHATPNGSYIEGSDWAPPVYKYVADFSDLCPTFNVTSVGSLSGPGVVNWGQFCSWEEYQYWCAGNGAAMGLPAMAANSLVGISIHDNCPPNNYPSLPGNAWGNTSSGESLSLTQLRSHWEKGWAQSYATLRALKPGILCGGNNTNYLSNGWTPQNSGWSDVSFYENPQGYGLTYNTWSGFIKNCLQLEPITITNKPSCMIGSLEYAGPGPSSAQNNQFPNSQSSWTAVHYQGARIQAAVMAGLWWIAGMGQGNGTVYIDEWDAGVSNPGYLGPPSGSRTLSNGGGSYFQNTYSSFNAASASAAAAGIATFPFANGTIYANLPTTNNVGQGSGVTLTSSQLQNGGGRNITYTLAGSNSPPNVVSGAAFTSLYIQPYDAVFTLNSTVTSQAFPRFGVQAFDAAQLPQSNTPINGLAQYPYIQLGGDYPGAIGGLTRDQIVTGLHSQTLTGKNAVKPIVVQYEIMNYTNGNCPEWVTAVGNNNWYLYTTGSSGSKVSDSDGYLVDIARVAGTDSATGLYPGQWQGQYVTNRYLTGGGLATSTNFSTFGSANLDGIYMDNQSGYLQGSGDYLRNGTTQGAPANQAAVNALTQGMVDMAVKFRALNPGKLILGNTDYAYATIGLGLTETNLNGLFDYPMAQFIWGYGSAGAAPQSVYQIGGFSLAFQYYKQQMTSGANGSCTVTAQFHLTDWQQMRQAICATLMDNGYLVCGISSGANTDGVDGNNPSTWPVCDEFWGGTLATGGYLGQPLTTSQGQPQSTAWQNGILRRDFQNGIVLANTSSSASPTTALGSTYYHLRSVYGSQSINDGSAVNSISLAGNDACVLLNNAPP